MELESFATELSLKTVSAERRIISGWAAHHHTIDRVRDIIDPVASQKAVARLKSPSDVGVFIAHQATLPVGIPQVIQATPQGLYTETYILKGAVGDNLLAIAKDLLDHGMTLGLSIGFKTHDSKMEHTAHGRVRRLLDYSLAEFSYAAHQAVANPSATMLSVKSRRQAKAMTAGTDTAGGALVPADPGKPQRGGPTTMQYRVEQNGDRWVVYCDMDADGDADDNVPVGTYDSAETANAVVVALRAQQSMAAAMDADDDEATGDGDDMDGGKTAAAADEGKAVWSTAMENNLEDSCFLYISPGGAKDDEGKTVPRTLRHLPYKTSPSAAPDLPHLRNAIARIPQMTGIGADKKAQLQARARRLLSAAGGGQGKTVDDTAAEWAMDGGPLTVAALGYKLVDLSEQLADELKAMALLGEETKSYQRMRAPARDALRAVAADLLRMADHAERIDKGEDGIARLNWLKQQFALTEV